MAKEPNSEREDNLDSASKKLDSTVDSFRSFVDDFGKINEGLADKFKATLSHTEKSQLAVFAAATNIQRSFDSVFDGMEESGEKFSGSGAFLANEITTVAKKSFEANRAEARELRKDLESLRKSASVLSGEERKKIEGLINIASDQLKEVGGGVSVFREAVRNRFDPANMAEKLLGGGLIGGMVGDMMRIKRQRKKSAALTEFKTGSLSAGGGAVLGELENIRESVVSTADPKQNELFEEEEQREAARNKVGKAAGVSMGSVDVDVDSGNRFADMLWALFGVKWLTMLWAGLKTRLLIPLWSGMNTYLFAPLWAGVKHFILAPLWKGLMTSGGWLIGGLKSLWLKTVFPFLSGIFNSFIAKLAASKVWGAVSGAGRRVGGAVAGMGRSAAGSRVGQAVAGGTKSLRGWAGKGWEKMKGASAASKAASAPKDIVSAATSSAGKATSAAGAATSKTPKKGILKSLADGIKSFGRKGIMRGILNLGLLAIAMIPFAIAMKLFSSGVTMGGIFAFAASITVLVIAVKALSKMGSQIVKGALAMSILGVALIPLAFGLSLMKNVGIGTIFVLAAALLTLGVAANIFGIMAANPFFWFGILAIAALGVALLPLAYAMKIAAEAFQIFTTAIDIEKMMLIGPMLMLAAPGLLLFGTAAMLAAPGLILLGFASMFLTASKASETLPLLLESFADFSERVNPSNLFRGALGIIALGGALLAFTAAGVAAQALATVGNVAANFMTLGGLLGASAPGPFDMLKMFIAFGEHGDGIGRGADGIEKLRNSMASFATMDTEGIKEGVTSVIDAIDEFSRAAFRAAFYGGIGNFLLGSDPLDSFIMLAKVGPGIGVGADGIKRLGEAFTEFSKLGKSGAMSFFQEGIVSESGFENLMESLSDSLSEIDEDEFETKIALLERLANAMNALAGGKPMQPIQAGQGGTNQAGQGAALAPDDPRNAWADSANPNLRAEHRRLTTPSTATMGRETEGVGTAVMKKNKNQQVQKQLNKSAFGTAKLRAKSALSEKLGTSELPPGVQYKTTVDEENQLVTTIAYIGKKVEEIDGKITGATNQDASREMTSAELETMREKVIAKGPVSSTNSAKHGHKRKVKKLDAAIREAKERESSTQEEGDNLHELRTFRDEKQKDLDKNRAIVADPNASDWDVEEAEAWIEDDSRLLKSINAEIKTAEGPSAEGPSAKQTTPQGKQFAGGRQQASELRAGTVISSGQMGAMGQDLRGDEPSNVEIIATEGGMKSVVRMPVGEDGGSRFDKSMAKHQALQALSVTLGIPGAREGKFSPPPGIQTSVKTETEGGKNFIVVESDYDSERTLAVTKMRDDMNAMGGSRGSAVGLGVGGPQDLARRARIADAGSDVGSNPASMQSANNSLNSGAIASSERASIGTTLSPSGQAVVVNTSNNVNQAADTFFTQNPSTRNNESSLQKSTRRVYDDQDY
jgi:hypothetical protein